jgi:hypothetical protein
LGVSIISQIKIFIHYNGNFMNKILNSILSLCILSGCSITGHHKNLSYINKNECFNTSVPEVTLSFTLLEVKIPSDLCLQPKGSIKFESKNYTVFKTPQTNLYKHRYFAYDLSNNVLFPSVLMYNPKDDNFFGYTSITASQDFKIELSLHHENKKFLKKEVKEMTAAMNRIIDITKQKELYDLLIEGSYSGAKICKKGILDYTYSPIFTECGLVSCPTHIPAKVKGKIIANVDNYNPKTDSMKLYVSGWASDKKINYNTPPRLGNIPSTTGTVVYDNTEGWVMCD